MMLLLVRHAHAGDRDPAQWPDDTERPLTDKGRKVHAKVSRALRNLEIVPELVLTSPLTRAAQTAEIMRQELLLPQPPVPCPALAGEPDLARIAAEVGPRGDRAVVALVGHSPWIEELAALLLAGSARGVKIDFPKSGVLAVEADRLAPGSAALRFFLRPKML
ncbi:MAG TPA: histidine phosphatase family protein [Gemmatimonadales bacterium]|nr:histidine phosphatase family protein [Gemmatimonadales bacterium]